MAVNLLVDLAAGRFGAEVEPRAHAAAAAAGFVLRRADANDERLAAWIDWQFAPSWWSAEARASDVFFALDAAGEIAGFVAYDGRGLRFPWLRAYEGQPDVGVFGPYGVAPAHRKSGLGAALLDAALAALHAKGYGRAVIPAVNYPGLIAMYERRAGASVADSFSYAAPRRFRTTILASGSGTNAQNVFARVAAGELPLEIAGVVVNSAQAPVIARAHAAEVPVRIVTWDRAAETRPQYDARVIEAVAATEPELVVLLGWMHLLPPAFIARFPEIVNVHPAFLPLDPRSDDVVLPDGAIIPAFRGAHAVRDALRAGVTWTGASVHRVTTETDRGAIVVRTPLKLVGETTVDAVADRLRPIEHGAVAAALRRWSFERAYGNG